MNIDNGVNSEKANWKFDKQVTNIFESHVRKSVPMYDEFHKTVADLSEWFVEEYTNVYDIGTSTGESLKNIYLHHKNKTVKYIGVDSSIDMIDKAKEEIENENISLVNEDVLSNNFKISNASYITSILTLQFISPKQRKEVVGKIYRGLNKGGAFVLVEKVVGNNARFDEMFVELYHDFKLESGLSKEEIFDKSRAIRGVMRPNTVQENLNLLSSVGFTDIDIFFKWCNFIGIIAIK